MSLAQLFQSKVPEIFSFVTDEFGFKFENINKFLVVARKEGMNLYFIFDKGLLFSVEIEVTGKLGDIAINNPKYRKLGASTMAECIDDEYKLKFKYIKNENDLLSEMEEEAKVLKKYCRNILAGDVSSWESIVNCLLRG